VTGLTALAGRSGGADTLAPLSVWFSTHVPVVVWRVMLAVGFLA